MQRRVAALILITLLVALGGVSATTAQDSQPAVGTPVTYVDPDGIIRGDITVREMTDPFTDHEPSAPPAEGTRYVQLVATFQAAIDQTLDAQPSSIYLQDTDGYLYPYVYVSRPVDPLMPDLQAQTLAPDNRISGALFYDIPSTATLDRVVYQPSYDRLIEIADLGGGAGPAVGDPITYTWAGGSSATVTTPLIDPFTGNDPAYPPTEGTRFVVLQPVFDNTGQLPYYADPYDFALRDANGFVHGPASVYQPQGVAVPFLESQTMSPGDRVSGYVGFSVPADAQLADIIYYPESGRYVTLANLLGGGVPAPDQPPASAAARPRRHRPRRHRQAPLPLPRPSRVPPPGSTASRPDLGSAYARTVGTSYRSKRRSTVTIERASTCACAMSNRSNGS